MIRKLPLQGQGRKSGVLPDAGDRPLLTPDGRYVVVRGQLWRAGDPRLTEPERRHWTQELMAARRALRRAGAGGSDIRNVRARVDEAKRALGERGPPWWNDGAPDYGRRDVGATPYADWYAAQSQHGEDEPPPHHG